MRRSEGQAEQGAQQGKVLHGFKGSNTDGQ
jgi:hypothetical protein